MVDAWNRETSHVFSVSPGRDVDSSSDLHRSTLLKVVLSSPYLKLKWASSPYAKWDPSGRSDEERAQFRYSKICYSRLRDYMGVFLNWQPSWKASGNSLLKSPFAPCTLPRPLPFGTPGWNSRTRHYSIPSTRKLNEANNHRFYIVIMPQMNEIRGNIVD